MDIYSSNVDEHYKINYKSKILINIERLPFSILLFLFVFFTLNKVTEFKLIETTLYSFFISLLTLLKFNLSYRLRSFLSYFFVISGPCIMFILVELLNGNVPWADLEIWQIGLNLIWYYIIYTFFILIIRRVNVSLIVSSFLCYIFGTINHYVLLIRGTIIFPADILAWRTALNVANNFSFVPDDVIIRTGILLFIYFMIIYKIPLLNQKIDFSKKIVISLVSIILGYNFIFFGTNALEKLEIYAQQWKTQANGFFLNFTTALRYSFVEEPQDYTEENLEEISDIPLSPTDTGKSPDDIIVIMNESFSDLSIFDNLETNEEVMPFYKSLKEDTIKGTAYSSVTGGGTANSEFEFLTGNTLAFLPKNTVAYQLYIKEGAPSLVNQLNSLGYESTAFHPYKASGWNRPTVYNKFGFSSQLYDKDVKSPKYVRKYISDKSDYEQIYKITDNSDKRNFIFNVTMQNHSGYLSSWNNLEKSIHISGNLFEKLNSLDDNNILLAANQYLSLIRESDNSLKELIEHYSNVDKPTMIVFYGDHQPPLSTEFYESLYDKKLDDRELSEIYKQYEVPFFIWTNYDIEEKEDVKLSLNYLGVLACETANIPLTGYQQFLKNLYEEIPVINSLGCITKTGRIVSFDDIELLTQEQKELLKEYNLLSYNNLFEPDEMIPDFFYLEDK